VEGRTPSRARSSRQYTESTLLHFGSVRSSPCDAMTGRREYIALALQGQEQ